MTLKFKSSSEGDFIVIRFVTSRRIRRRKRCAKRSSYAQDIARLCRAYAEHTLERAWNAQERAGTFQAHAQPSRNAAGTPWNGAERGQEQFLPKKIGQICFQTKISISLIKFRPVHPLNTPSIV